MSENQTEPNFFIVGAPKAGTTSLYKYLENHPDVFMSALKETNFFSYQEIEEQKLYYKEKGIGDWKNYLTLFENAGGKKAIGEASVSYLFYPKTAAAIKEKYIEARIIIMLRNPVERALSHYFMDYKMGYMNRKFSDIVFRSRETHLQKMQYQQYIELGLYAEQVKRYIDAFGREKVMLIFFEDFKANTASEVKRLYRFLNVEEKFLVDTTQKHNAFQTPRNKFFLALYRFDGLRKILKNILPASLLKKIKSSLMTDKKEAVDENTIAHLKKLFEPDVRELEKLLNRDLKSWYA